jgi:hypothetical protein
MRLAGIALLTATIAAAASSPTLALGPPVAPGHPEPLVIRTGGIFTHDDVRTPYFDELFALRSRETGACGFGRQWYPFPGTRRGGFHESPGPCRIRMYRKRYR